MSYIWDLCVNIATSKPKEKVKTRKNYSKFKYKTKLKKCGNFFFSIKTRVNLVLEITKVG